VLILAHATPITLLVLALFYKWFALDDRYAVFLYNHLGATPFDDVTTSRYVMAGLVACGALMLLDIAVNLALARIVKSYRAPEWSRVWAVSALPLVVGIVLITTTQNAPTLPPNLALACVIVTLVGLIVALTPGALAAENPRALGWLALDGFGLILPLTTVRVIEMTDKVRSIAAPVWYGIAIGSIVFGAAWLIGMSFARQWRRAAMPSARAIFFAGICWSYLALPLVHYLFATPSDFKYITAASNFFATNAALEIGILFIALVLAGGATEFRKCITHRGHAETKQSLQDASRCGP